MAPSVTFHDYCNEWLADIRDGNPSNVELGRRFAHKLVMQWMDGNDEADEVIYCDGAGDGGIDLAYLHRGENIDGEGDGALDGDRWYLIQSKYGTAFQGPDTLFTEGRKVIDALSGNRSRLSSVTEDLLERLKYFRAQASELDRVVLIFATVNPLTKEQRLVLNDVRALGRERLGSLFDVEAISIETIYQHTLEDDHLLIRIPIRANLVPSGRDLLVGAVSLSSLYDFLNTYRSETNDLDKLFEKNVRRFLGSRGKVNKAIQATLKETPENFGLYNNGITIVVNDFRPVDSNTYELVEPYIVNGCQTTRTVWEVCHQRFESGGTGFDLQLTDWKARASAGVVIVKIVKVGSEGEALLLDITRFTNSQNAVREKDFLALTDDFRAWAEQMAAKFDVFLEIQRGGWESQRAYQKQHPETHQFYEHANAFDLLKVYGAGWLGEAGNAFGRNSAFLPNGTVFKKIMNGSGARLNEDDFYAAHLLQIAADSFQFGRGAQNTRRQTRFLFYMVVVDLLRDIMRIQGLDTRPDCITVALLQLFQCEDPNPITGLLNHSIQLIDEYMTKGTFDSKNVFNEPAYSERYNADLNAFLKWDQLGQADGTPHLHSLIADYRRLMSRSIDDQPSPATMIIDTLLE